MFEQCLDIIFKVVIEEFKRVRNRKFYKEGHHVETIFRSSGSTRRYSNIWTNWMKVFTWCAEFPMRWLRNHAKYLESW